MGRKSHEGEICRLILDELYDIKEKKGITFNALFKKIKMKRGKFSYDTLAKYLGRMERDGRVIRIVDVDSNRKIKPTYIYKNEEIINLQTEKGNFNKILMDQNTTFKRFQKQQLKGSDLFPKFNELLWQFLGNELGIKIEYFGNDQIVDWKDLLENFDLFIVENPEIEGSINNLIDIILLLYYNILEYLIKGKNYDSNEINFNLLFQIDFSSLLAGIILKFATKIQQERPMFDEIFVNPENVPKLASFSEEKILQVLFKQMDPGIREFLIGAINKKRLDEFSEKYKKIKFF
ncbi:MAG: hypothetical protein ACTSRS_05125 [Candidatus Helarchaeota archaeon]